MGIFDVIGPTTIGIGRGRHSSVITDTNKVLAQLEGYLTHEDLDKIQAINKPVEFNDTHVHHVIDLHQGVTIIAIVNSNHRVFR